MNSIAPPWLTPPQQDVIDSGLLDTGFNCVLQMATGSGKTWLAAHAIQQTINRGFRAIYVCPTRALAAELYETWRLSLPDTKIGVFTGDFGKADNPYPVSFSDAQILLMTPEKLDSCTRHWRTHWGWIPETDLMVVDEFHLLGDGYRGARLEGAMLRLQRLNPFLRVLGLSATLGNRNELTEWLNGVEYHSDWRPVPLTWKYVRFKKAEEKPALLNREVARVTQCGGKSLVFAQSRRRAEALAAHLVSQGLRANHHHAGLGFDRRRDVENRFRANQIDVLVTTSTLEVGLNLPVRQVVLYDLQAFDGSEYHPLPHINVWQRVGRAGRFGLDSEGEAVLFSPSWTGKAIAYEQGKFEPCLSSYGSPKILAEQVIAELSSGLVRTRTELRTVLNESLAKAQGRLGSTDELLEEMIEAGLISEAQQAEGAEREVRLKPTTLGRIVARHMLTPHSALIFRNVIKVTGQLTFFDILLVACSVPDCEPVIPVDFETIEDLIALLQNQTTKLGGRDIPLEDLLECNGRRLLSSIKMALCLDAWTRDSDLEKVATQMDCYPAEIRRLCDSLSRTLPAFAAIVEIPSNSADDNPKATVTSQHLARRIRFLEGMIEMGLSAEEISLTLVPGIGKTWAKKLSTSGIHHVEELAQASIEALITLGGLSHKRALQWIDSATEMMNSDDLYLLADIGSKVEVEQIEWPKGIEPYRLRRSLSLTVDENSSGRYHVTGGSDPHLVDMRSETPTCDCLDFAKGNYCKHLLAVQAHVGDGTVLRAQVLLRQINRSPHLDLMKLWMT